MQRLENLADCQQLIKKCMDGDRISQAKLYTLYAGKMLGVCMWYAKNKEEAEEILQDGFIRAFTYLHKFRAEGSFEGWIRKIMVNAALFKYRNKSYLKPLVAYSSDTHDVAEMASVFIQIEVKELVKLIQSLTPAYRMVFNLFVMEGMKHREIAKILGISEGTSKSNLADARAALQRSLRTKNRMALV